MASELAQRSPHARRDFSGGQLKLIRRRAARMCTDAVLDGFIAVAAHSGLERLRRQIAPLIAAG